MARRLVLAATASLAWAVSMAGAAEPAMAAQHQNAYYYSHWSFTGASAGYWNVDQDVSIAAKAQATYWAQLWSWNNSSEGGYLGLQTNGSRFNGTTGDTAIFSLWNATGSRGGNCGTFAGEGTGKSCRLAYPFKTGRLYRLRMWRLDADATGQWWGAWIRDSVTGVDTYLGALSVDRSRNLMTNVQNFVEYFGSQTPCRAVPKSTATWTQPAANSRGNGTYQFGSRYYATSGDRGSCTGGSATPVNLGWTKGVRVVLGG